MEVSLNRTFKPAMRFIAKPGSRWTVPITIAVGLAVWEGLVRWGGFPSFILPSPEMVWARLLTSIADGSLPRNAAATLVEVILGLVLGVSLATILGYLLGKSHLLERLLSPFLVASQAVPVVAIAPLLIIWLSPACSQKCSSAR